MVSVVFLEKLTSAEHRVLLCCMTDDSCKQIADKLNLSVETVKTHRKNIAHKAGTKGKTEFRLFLRRLEQEAVL